MVIWQGCKGPINKISDSEAGYDKT
jgi:hypothetical protein